MHDWQRKNAEITIGVCREEIADLQSQIRERQRLIRANMAQSFKAQRRILELERDNDK